MEQWYYLLSVSDIRSEPQHQHQSERLEKKFMKGLDTPPSGEKNSALNPALLFVKPAKDPDADKEIVSTKMCIDNTIA